MSSEGKERAAWGNHCGAPPVRLLTESHISPPRAVALSVHMLGAGLRKLAAVWDERCVLGWSQRCQPDGAL